MMGSAADGGESYSDFILKKFKSKYLMKVFVCSEGLTTDTKHRELMKLFSTLFT